MIKALPLTAAIDALRANMLQGAGLRQVGAANGGAGGLAGGVLPAGAEAVSLAVAWQIGWRTPWCTMRRNLKVLKMNERNTQAFYKVPAGDHEGRDMIRVLVLGVNPFEDLPGYQLLSLLKSSRRYEVTVADDSIPALRILSMTGTSIHELPHPTSILLSSRNGLPSSAKSRV